jgi:hypothetical protein
MRRSRSGLACDARRRWQWWWGEVFATEISGSVVRHVCFMLEIGRCGDLKPGEGDGECDGEGKWKCARW